MVLLENKRVANQGLAAAPSPSTINKVPAARTINNQGPQINRDKAAVKIGEVRHQAQEATIRIKEDQTSISKAPVVITINNQAAQVNKMGTKTGEVTTKIKGDPVPVAVTINNQEHQTNSNKVEAVANNQGLQQVKPIKIKGDLILINKALQAATISNQELINKLEKAVASSQVVQPLVVIRTKEHPINKALPAATTNKLVEVVSNQERHHQANKVLVITISSQAEVTQVNKDHPVAAIIKISSPGLLQINKTLAPTITNKLVAKALPVLINNKLQVPTIKVSLLQLLPVLTSLDQVQTNNKVEETKLHLENSTKLNLVKY